LQAWHESPKDLGSLFAPIIAKGYLYPLTENYGSISKKLAVWIDFERVSQKIQVERLGFFHLCPQDTTSFAWHTQHHFERSENIIAARTTQMNEVALRANDVLRNDVGLRPTVLRFAQTELSRSFGVLK